MLVEHDDKLNDGQNDGENECDFQAPAFGALWGYLIKDSTVFSVASQAGLVVHAPWLLKILGLPYLFDVERSSEDSVVLWVGEEIFHELFFSAFVGCMPELI